MPHKCVKCAKIFANSSKQLLYGCECGSRIFLFLRDDQVTIQEALDNNLTLGAEVTPADKPVDSKKYDWLEEDLKNVSKKTPVSIDLGDAENLRILERGSYEIDVSSLMQGTPLVVKDERGVYFVKFHLPKEPLDEKAIE